MLSRLPIAGLLTTGLVLHAQPPARPSFEVAVVRVSKGATPFRMAGGPRSSGPGQIAWSAVTLTLTLSQALKDLGLRLESSRGPVEMLIVDHAGRLPPEN